MNKMMKSLECSPLRLSLIDAVDTFIRMMKIDNQHDTLSYHVPIQHTIVSVHHIKSK